MSRASAQYLLRFDDLCPTMARVRWKRFERVLEEFAVRPILAVVPDNRDPALICEPPDPDFWKKMRAWEEAGATIALHGYRHVCASSGRSMIPAPTYTEFAGVPEHMQRRWISEGLQILRAHGLRPRLWIAPRHGFDEATLRALRAEGIQCVSDGLARVPFVRGGLHWIPQQLWEPEERRTGLWTICIHSNTAASGTAERLRTFLAKNRAQVTTFDRVNAEWHPKRLGIVNRARELVADAKRNRAIKRSASQKVES
jgi:predicted deacetylase